MKFDFHEAIEILERTPGTLETLLSGLSPDWVACNEGEGTWNASQVIDHLIEGEKTIGFHGWSFYLKSVKPSPSLPSIGSPI